MFLSDLDLVKKLNKNNLSCAQCRLCLRFEHLQMSHIFPAWLWKAIKSGGSYTLLEPSTKAASYQGELKQPLLCRNCESLLGKHERVVAKLFNKWKSYQRPRQILNTSNSKREVHFQDIPVPEFVDVNYKSLKIVVLACFWRASESCFNSYRPQLLQGSPPKKLITEEFSEKIRLMLLHEDPGEDYDLPILPTLDSTGLKVRAKELEINLGSDGKQSFLRAFACGIEWVLVLTSDKAFQQSNVRRLQSNDRCYFEIEDLSSTD